MLFFSQIVSHSAVIHFLPSPFNLRVSKWQKETEKCSRIFLNITVYSIKDKKKWRAGRKKTFSWKKKAHRKLTNQNSVITSLYGNSSKFLLFTIFYLFFFFPFFPFLCFPLSSYMVINCPYHLPLELWRLESLFLSYDRHAVIMFPNNTWYSK